MKDITAIAIVIHISIISTVIALYISHRTLTAQLKDINQQIELIHRMMEQEIEMFLTDEQQELINKDMESDITVARKKIEQLLRNYNYDFVTTTGSNRLSIGDTNVKEVSKSI